MVPVAFLLRHFVFYTVSYITTFQDCIALTCLTSRCRKNSAGLMLLLSALVVTLWCLKDFR